MNVLITAGGTSEKIDSVRKITNSSSGRLSSVIANRFEGDNVFYVASKKAIIPNIKNLKCFYVESVNELLEQVKYILTNYKIDLCIHAMAVSDYMVDYVTTTKNIIEQTKHSNIESVLLNPETRFNKNEKISSYEDDLFVRMIKTPKVISFIKKISPSTKLIGFKLLDKASNSELVEAGKKIMLSNDCDAVIANDLHRITEDSHFALYLDKSGNVIELNSKQEIADLLYKFHGGKNE